MSAVEAGWLAQRLREPSEALGVALPEGVVTRLAQYASLLLEWGARINLTGARTAEALVDQHLADALALLPDVPEGPFRLVDVGSGAGLPGLVVVLVRAECTATLLEPRRKRHAFLAHAVRTLGLRGRVETLAERLEEHVAKGGATRYDVAVARAVWPAAEWLERGRGLVRPGGLLMGLEGAERQPIPEGSRRRFYRIGGRERAVVTLRL